LNSIAARGAICLCALLLAACSVGDKTIMLRFKYEPGTRLVYDQVSKRKVVLKEADSTIQDYSYTFNMIIEHEVRDIIQDSIAAVWEKDTWQYERPTEKDSTVIDTIVSERELLMDIYPNGRITNLRSATDESVEHLSYIKNFYEQGVPVFPSGELSPGFSWTQTTKVILPEETMEASTTFKIKSLAREGGYDCAIIESDGNLVIPVEPGSMDTLMISGLDRIHTTGLIYFAYREGMVVLQRERWVVDGTREEMKDGKKRTISVGSTTDVDFSLRSRTIQ